VAGRRSGAEPIRRRRRSVRGRPAPWNRRRRAGACRGPSSGDWRRVVRRAAAQRGAVPDDSHRRRLLDHTRPSRIDRSTHRDRDRRRRGRGHDRPERRRRVGRALRPPRHSPDRRSARVCGPALATPCKVGESATASLRRAAADDDGACASSAQRRSPGRGAAATGDPRPRCAAREGALQDRHHGASYASAETANASRRERRSSANQTTLDAACEADLGALAHRQAVRSDACVRPGSLSSRARAACFGAGRRRT
jgi:hypothetical protein